MGVSVATAQLPQACVSATQGIPLTKTAGADFGRETQSADARPHAYDYERQLELE